MKKALDVKQAAKDLKRKCIKEMYDIGKNAIESIIDSEGATIELINKGFISMAETDYIIEKNFQELISQYKNMGISERCLNNWSRKADKNLEVTLETLGWKLIDEGIAPLDYEERKQPANMKRNAE